MTAARTSHGWNLFFTNLFDKRYRQLRESVKEIRRTKGDDVAKTHPDVKLFAALVRIIHEIVPSDPNHKQFLLGGTLGDKHKEWRRVKRNGLPDRLRLFFRFGESPNGQKVIVYAWLNGEGSLRKEGARDDVYTVFKKMLDNKNPPSTLAALLSQPRTGKEDEA